MIHGLATTSRPAGRCPIHPCLCARPRIATVAGTLIPAAYATPRACARIAREFIKAQRAEFMPVEPAPAPSGLSRYGFFEEGCGTACDEEMRSAAVLSAPWIATDCSATTCDAVVTNPEATFIAAALISGSDAIFSASACTAAARSSSDFWSSGDGLKETESLL